MQEQYNKLSSSEKSLVNGLVNKVRLVFCRNPNEIIIVPNRIFYISSFIFKKLKKCYLYESEYVELCKLTINKVMELFPENIHDREKVDYIIDYLLNDFYITLKNW